MALCNSLYEAGIQRFLLQGFTRLDNFVRLLSCLLSVYHCEQLSGAKLEQEEKEKEQELKHSHVPPTLCASEPALVLYWENGRSDNQFSPLEL